MYFFVLYLSGIAFLRMALIKVKERRSLFIFISCAILLGIASFRSVQFSPDTALYVSRYISLGDTPYNIVWQDSVKDPFFYLIAKVLSTAAVPPQVWLAAMSAVFIGAFGCFVYRYSSEPLMSFFFLVCLGYLYFSFSGLRQSLAISFVLFSFPFLFDRKFLPFAFFVLVASAFHISALVFFIFYFSSNINLSRYYLPLAAGALGVAIFFDSFIRRMVLLLGWGGLDRYAEATQKLNYSGLIIQGSMFFFCLLYKNSLIERRPDYRVMYDAMFIGVILQAMALVVAEFFRLGLYFSIVGAILVPVALMQEKNLATRALAFILIVSFMLFTMLRSGQFDSFNFYF